MLGFSALLAFVRADYKRIVFQTARVAEPTGGVTHVFVSHCQISTNVNGHGGGIHIESSIQDLIVRDCALRSCSATGSDAGNSGYGGAIWTDCGSSHIVRCCGYNCLASE
jgi:hypothetical protein